MKAGIPFRVFSFEHQTTEYGKEAADELTTTLGIDPQQIVKTLIIKLSPTPPPGESAYAVAMIPVPQRLNLRRAAQACGASRASMASASEAEKITGYVVGGISPFGGRRPLPMLLDEGVMQWDHIYVSAGRRGYDMEITPQDLLAVTRAQLASLIQ